MGAIGLSLMTGKPLLCYNKGLNMLRLCCIRLLYLLYLYIINKLKYATMKTLNSDQIKEILSKASQESSDKEIINHYHQTQIIQSFAHSIKHLSAEAIKNHYPDISNDIPSNYSNDLIERDLKYISSPYYQNQMVIALNQLYYISTHYSDQFEEFKPHILISLGNSHWVYNVLNIIAFG